jgi:tetratricopeptide (TPR) repeat protein
MTETLFLVLVGIALLPFLLSQVASKAYSHGAWRFGRVLARPLKVLLGSSYGASLVFEYESRAVLEAGNITSAAAMAQARVAEGTIPSWSRNTAVDVLIAAGAYEAALRAEPPPCMPKNAADALGLALIQINLAEAEYNLGRWNEAESRLRPLDLACWPFPIARAGLLQQRAWIAAHLGRPEEALRHCMATKPHWLPKIFRAEYYFTRVATHLAAGRLDDADAALAQADGIALRTSSKRNVLFLRARIAAARGDWATAERQCREAANHPFRGQGGDGLLLWARALQKLGRTAEATHALRLVAERDPESEAARTASATAGNELSRGSG